MSNSTFTLYVIAVADINDSSKIYKVFNGYEYVPNIEETAFITNKIQALKEAGGQQKLNEMNEVKVIPISVELPFQLSPIPIPQIETQAVTTNDTLSDTLSAT